MSERYPELAELLAEAEALSAEAAGPTAAELLDADECERLRAAGDAAELARRYLDAVRQTQGAAR